LPEVSDERQMLLRAPLRVKKLKAGQSVVLRFSLTKLSLVTGGSSQFTAFVDSGNGVSETNENNNRVYYTITLP
jgi:subtilase family serine protease